MSKRKPLQSGNCLKCQVWRASRHKDHIIPRWQGGLDIDTNYQYLCANCHEDKTYAERATPEYRAYVSGQAKTRMLSKRARQRISKAVKAANAKRVWTPEMKQRCSRKGVKKAPFTTEHCANISAARKGKKLSKKHCASLRKAHPRLPWSAKRREQHEAKYPNRYPKG